MMRYAFVLLALIVGTVFGGDIDLKVSGFTEDGIFCNTTVHEVLYEECVVDKAIALGASFDRRLELRGDRDLQYLNCDSCSYEMKQKKGYWCYYLCTENRSGRRLTITNVNADGGEVNHCRFTAAAKECYLKKAEKVEYQCLGNPADLKVKVRYYEQSNV
jgi:hypothetical protein